MEEINDVLKKALRRLDDDSLMQERGEEEIRRSNSIKGVSSQMLNIIKLNLKIFETAEKYDCDINDIKEALNIDD